MGGSFIWTASFLCILLRQFTADASHELRTPLTAMQTILSLIREKKRPAREYCQALDDLGEETDRLNIATIFKRFYTVDASRSAGGTGLGLSIGRQILEAHRGRIEVESEVNRGTRFTVRLPK